jgi:putative ABC transport system ATP-binding protein
MNQAPGAGRAGGEKPQPQAGRPPIVRVQQASRIYQRDSVPVAALHPTDLDIAQGDFAALVGPSGSGKTTLLNLIGGLDRPTSGQVWIGDVDLTTLDARALAEVRLRRIGFVFQEYNLVPVLSALENIEYVMLLQGVAEAARRERALQLLGELGLEGMEHRRPNELSGGQQQRVAVARAIAARPMIVLLDEPTANLDSQSGARLMDLLRRLNEEQGTTFVFSTHDPMVVERARRVIRLRDGRIEADERRS